MKKASKTPRKSPANSPEPTEESQAADELAGLKAMDIGGPELQTGKLTTGKLKTGNLGHDVSGEARDAKGEFTAGKGSAIKKPVKRKPPVKKKPPAKKRKKSSGYAVMAGLKMPSGKSRLPGQPPK